MADAVVPLVEDTTPAETAKAKVKKPKATATHPKYAIMISAAISALKEKPGSSFQSIVKYITANYNVDAKKASSQVKIALKRGVTAGTLKQVTGDDALESFVLVTLPDNNSKANIVQAKKSANKHSTKKTSKKTPAKKNASKRSAKKATVKKSPAKKSKKPAKKSKATKKPAKKPTKKKASKPKKPAAKKAKK